MDSTNKVRSKVSNLLVKINEIGVWRGFSDMLNAESSRLFVEQFDAEPHAIDFARALFQELRRDNIWLLSLGPWIENEIVKSDNKTARVSIRLGGKHAMTSHHQVVTVPLSYSAALAVMKHANREDAPVKLTNGMNATEFIETLLGESKLIDRRKTSDTILRNTRRRQAYEVVDVGMRLADVKTELHVGDATLV